MIEIDIAHRIGNFTLEVKLEIGRETVVLFGPSGAGKSATLRSVAGLLEPLRGRIALNGRVVFDRATGINLAPRVRHIGYVPQNYALFPHMTVLQNIAYALPGVVHREAERRVREMVALVGLEKLEARYPRQLSGGQQQRVALARALAAEPVALLLDEPLSALDPPTRSVLRAHLRELQQHFQIPVVYVTHDLTEAYLLADRIAIYAEGRLLQVDGPGEVLRHPATRHVARLVGVKNILDGQLVRRVEGGMAVHVGEAELVTPPTLVAPGEDVTLCVRGERILFVRPERSSVQRDNLFRGRIVGETHDGTMVTLAFRMEGARLTPGREYDLEIELPLYAYERLGLGNQREWQVALRRDAIHLITEIGT